MTALMAFAAVGVIGFIIMSGGGISSAPEVAADRLELDPVLGDPNAPVTITEYAAYGCHACRAWHQQHIVENILNEFPGQVNFVVRDFPVIAPAYDRMAANVAQCALDQSQDMFWALHDGLYTVLDVGASQEDILRLGERIGLDYDTLKTCAEDGTHRATVDYDLNRARDLGLPGTPSFLVNGQRLFNPNPQTLRDAVVQAINS